MSAIQRGPDGRYDVDFDALSRRRHPWWNPSRWLPLGRAQVDPLLVVDASVGVLDAHEARGADGQLLVGSSWTLRLSTRDYHSIEPYIAGAVATIERRLAEAAQERGAEVDHVDFTIESVAGLERGRGRFVVETPPSMGRAVDRAGPAIDPSDPDTVVTIKDTRGAAERGRLPLTIHRPPKPLEAEAPVMARISCEGRVVGELRPGRRYTLGRRGGRGSHFITLPTDSCEISRRHLRLEVKDGQVVVARLEGNPVAVGRRQLGAGTETSVDLGGGPVELNLTNGQLVLVVEAA